MNHPAAILFFLLGLSCAASAGGRHDRSSSSSVAITTRVLNVNRFNIQVTDRGNLTIDTGGPGGGFWWYNDAMNWCVVYDQGPWIIGKLNGQLAMGASYWGTTYLPGPMVNGRSALEVHPEDSVRFHPYKISRTSTWSEPDFSQWPGDLGAPTDGSGNPLLLGDQMVWSGFNGVDSTVVLSDWTTTDVFSHLPVEIHQSLYAREGSHRDTSLLANCAFLEWTFINKGAAVIESCYVGLWADIDLWINDTPFGVDTVNQTGYCWQNFDLDTVHSQPEALGYVLLHGPCVPDPDSTALFRGKRRDGYRNLPLSSFWGMRNDWGSPSNPQYWPVGPNTIQQAWNIARGYDKSGQVIIDSVTHLPTRFPWSGDPLTGKGWIYSGSTEGEGGLMFFAGPFTFAPGDTQWTMIAILPAASNDKLKAIRTVRNNASRVRAMAYEDIARPRPLAVREDATVPVTTRLEQNYPNPFNPTTRIRYTVGRVVVPSGALLSGVEGPASSKVRLAVYDLLGKEVAVLVDERKLPGTYEVRFDGSRLSSGVYFYELTAGNFRDTKTLLLIK